MARITCLFLCVLLFSGCNPESSDPFIPEGVPPELATCSIAVDDIVSGGIGRDVIPALTDPVFVSASEAGYLADQDRVIGITVGGVAYAVPHNILWFHEIINLNLDSIQLAVTYCPLTGSSIAFDRAAIGGNEFGVSGLLYQNNLMMYDRTTNTSLWPQMSRQADCGPRLGARLEMYPVMDITWGGWQALHPDTRVVSRMTGHGIGYTNVNYPYGNYEEPTNNALLFNMEIDDRRPPKERLLGIPDTRRGGLALPLSEFEKGDSLQAVHLTADLGPVVAFWDASTRAVMAYKPTINGDAVQFEVTDQGIVDMETGSVWRVDGLATDGPLAGTQLEPIETAYVSFWFAWAAFQPDTQIWTQ